MLNRIKDNVRHDLSKLPPLPGEKTKDNASDVSGGFKLPEMDIRNYPMPSYKRHRMDEDGWHEEPNYDSPQEDTTFFDTLFGNKHYWSLGPNGIWIENTEGAIRRDLRKRYKLWCGRLDYQLNDIEKLLGFVEHHNRVDGVCDLAGFKAGVYCISPGQMILVPKGMQLIEPADRIVDDIIIQIFQEMFSNPEEPWQYESIISMLKLWYETLRNRTFDPAQAIVIVGDVNGGKTFVQEHCITPLLGGREASPFSYLCGESRFNDDLLESEHLKVSDEGGSHDINQRRIQSTKLKNLLFNQRRRVEAKFGKAANVPAVLRVTISCNPPDIKILPIDDSSMGDKMATFWCNPRPRLFPEYQGKPAFAARVKDALPSFIRYLVDYQIPPEIRQKPEAERCGVDTFRSKHVAELLHEFCPEERVWEQMRSILTRPSLHVSTIGPVKSPFEGNSSEIYMAMQIRNAEFTRTINAQSLGTYLSRLAAKADGRVEKKRLHKGTNYVLDFIK